jgi:hypothetical protein
MSAKRLFVLLLLAGTLGIAVWPTWAGPKSNPLYIPAVYKGVPSVTPSPRPTATATATRVPTHPATWVIDGLVYDASASASQPVAQANISILLCSAAGGQRLTAIAGGDGRYQLAVPSIYLDACGVVTLEVWATGYAPLIQVVTVPELRAQPHRNVGLAPVTASETVPLVRTATPTATPDPGGLVLTGTVYDADLGPSTGILGAVVRVTVCEPYLPVLELTDVTGHYRLVLPSTHLQDCPQVEIEVVAMGYQSHAIRIAVAELRAQPQRNYAMRAKVSARVRRVADHRL